MPRLAMKLPCLPLILSVWLVGVGLGFGQNFPAAPSTGLRDDTRALPESARHLLISEISAARQAVGCDIWLSASTFLPPGEDIRRYAKELRQNWSPSRDSVLLAYDRASDSHVLSFSPGLWQRYPSVQIVTILQQISRLMNQKDRPLDTRLNASMKALLRHLRLLEKQRQQSATLLHRQDFRLGQVYSVALACGALALALMAMILRRKDVIAAHQLFFPRAQVGIRFGAPHGGGVTTEKSLS
ncbi:hypothetical protein [Prosthecobacter debontii]|nr:hypothetical protein [Prosthecobacter debontii]